MAESLRQKHSDDPVVQLFGSYATKIKERDVARRKAEEAEKQRRAYWREYYKLNEELEKLEIDLGLSDATTQTDPTPAAPRKRPRRQMVSKNGDKVIDVSE